MEVITASRKIGSGNRLLVLLFLFARSFANIENYFLKRHHSPIHGKKIIGEAKLKFLLSYLNFVLVAWPLQLTQTQMKIAWI